MFFVVLSYFAILNDTLPMFHDPKLPYQNRRYRGAYVFKWAPHTHPRVPN